MKQAAFIEFCNRWMERDIVIAQRSGYLDRGLQAKAMSMFFRQGFTHSNQNTGVFTDRYVRSALIDDPEHSLVYITFKVLSEKYAEKQEYLIPISDRDLADAIIATNHPLVRRDFHCKQKTVQLGDKQVICINATLQSSSDNPNQLLLALLKFIAFRGAVATQDTLIQIFIDLGNMLNDHLTQDEECSSIVNDNVNSNTFDVIQLLRQAPLVANLTQENSKSYAFYCVYLEQLIQGFYDAFVMHRKYITLGEQLLYVQAIRRLYLKLLVVQQRDSDYKVCMNALEFAFDEVTNVLSIAKIYSRDDLFASIRNFIENNLHLSTDQMPTSVALAGSCMQVMHRKITSSLQYLAAGQSNKDIRVYIPHENYYKLSSSWGIPQDFLLDQCVTFRDMQPRSMQAYAGQIVDLMFLHFHANVNWKKRGFSGSNVQSVIENQFKLRESQNFSGQL